MVYDGYKGVRAVRPESVAGGGRCRQWNYPLINSLIFLSFFSLFPGNEIIHQITNRAAYELRVDLEDFEGNTRYAVYSSFSLDSKAKNYTLHLGNYSGNAGWYGNSQLEQEKCLHYSFVYIDGHHRPGFCCIFQC